MISVRIFYSLYTFMLFLYHLPYVYNLRPNQTQDLKMSNWVDMLRSHFNWCLNDRITQYNQQFIQGNYCDLRAKSVEIPQESSRLQTE